ncbi:MAG: hypothetical protein WCT39_05925 [Candidatus Margulisiibacteriota bacterium]
MQIRFTKIYSAQDKTATLPAQRPRFKKGVGLEIQGQGMFAATQHMLFYFSRVEDGQLDGIALTDDTGAVQAAINFSYGEVGCHTNLSFYAREGTALGQRELSDAWAMAIAFARGSMLKTEFERVISDKETRDRLKEIYFENPKDEVLYYSETARYVADNYDKIIVERPLNDLQCMAVYKALVQHKTILPEDITNAMAQRLMGRSTQFLAALFDAEVVVVDALPSLFG